MHLTVIVKLLVFSKRVGTSVPSYVLRVPSCPTCLTCFTCLTCLSGLHAHVLYVFACLHAFLRAFFFLLAVCAFIILSAFTLYVPSFFTCFVYLHFATCLTCLQFFTFITCPLLFGCLA